MLNTDFKLISITLSKSSSDILINKLSFVIPALLIKTSIVPNSAITSSTNFCASLKSAAFDLYPLALIPKAFNSFSNAKADSTDELYVKATFAPCSAKTFAIPLPIPRLAPVIMATFPSNNFMVNIRVSLFNNKVQI